MKNRKNVKVLIAMLCVMPMLHIASAEPVEVEHGTLQARLESRNDRLEAELETLRKNPD